MKAVVTSIGEPTTDLCVWSLERQGFEVSLYKDGTSLAQKLKHIVNDLDEPYLRVDADIVVNKNMTPQFLNTLDKSIWWWQFETYDWFKQDINYSMSFIRPEALPSLRANVDNFLYNLRPETELSRISELYNPRRFDTVHNKLMGLHGFGVKDLKPVIKLKAQRGQSHLYDFELTRRLNEL